MTSRKRRRPRTLSAFVMIDKRALRLLAVRKHWLAVYVAIASYRNTQTNTCNPTLERIALDAAVHRATVCKAIRNLVFLGLIERRREGRRNVYWFPSFGKGPESGAFPKAPPPSGAKAPPPETSNYIKETRGLSGGPQRPPAETLDSAQLRRPARQILLELERRNQRRGTA